MHLRPGLHCFVLQMDQSDIEGTTWLSNKEGGVSFASPFKAIYENTGHAGR